MEKRSNCLWLSLNFFRVNSLYHEAMIHFFSIFHFHLLLCTWYLFEAVGSFETFHWPVKQFMKSVSTAFDWWYGSMEVTSFKDADEGGISCYQATSRNPCILLNACGLNQHPSSKLVTYLDRIVNVYVGVLFVHKKQFYWFRNDWESETIPILDPFIIATCELYVSIFSSISHKDIIMFHCDMSKRTKEKSLT